MASQDPSQRQRLYRCSFRDGPIRDRYLARLRWLGDNLRDPFADQVGQADALDDVTVRYSYQQVPFTSFQQFGELAGLVAVCGGDDAYYSGLKLKVISEQTWIDLLGMPLVKFAQAGFLILSWARAHDGSFDVAVAADPGVEQYDLTPELMLTVFHRFMAAELAELRQRAAADRNPVPTLRHLDRNPLQATPFVGIGAGRYVAPSMHLAVQRLSLAAIYHIGLGKYKTAFAEDLGILIEAYVGRQLGQLTHDALVPEQKYGTKSNGGMTCDWVLSMSRISTVFEVKSARIALPGRRSYAAHINDMLKDVGHALDQQIRRTADLIRADDPVFQSYKLPTDVYGVVVVAEPHLMIGSEHYRGVLPDPGCPYVVLTLRELERFVAAVLAGAGAGDLVRALTASHNRPESVIVEAARAVGVPENPANPLLESAFDLVTKVPTGAR
ncbi:MAG: hypothetical protein JXA67_16355 [Micromonosporaceae bacterium]|nr:hypothetical protein [Micromonosporaceae bacterium]